MKHRKTQQKMRTNTNFLFDTHPVCVMNTAQGIRSLEES